MSSRPRSVRAPRASRLPRTVHPIAWWVWAIGMATASTWTTNPLLLLLLIAVTTAVVLARRGDSPWSRSFRLYVRLGILIVVLRVIFRIIFGGGEGNDVLFHLPSIPLPQWAAGIQLFGDVSAQSLLGGLYDGMRLATMVICLGAANALANPKRLLKSMPTGLYDVGTAIVVAVSVFPQLADSVLRVRRAQRLRGGLPKRHVIRALLIPVLADALDRSLLLAAAMDSRGYGRTGKSSRRSAAATGALTILGLIGVCAAVYNILDSNSPTLLKWPVLLLGLVLAASGLVAASRRSRTSRYRPDPFDAVPILIAAGGVGVAAVMYAATRYQAVHLVPSLQPLQFPVIDGLPLLAVVLGLLPILIAPPTPRTTLVTPVRSLSKALEDAA
ncbi:MAG: energy-coupling factor transporter transmembrane protein EcfT [Actinomycetota bacterium]|nr:energy-coupling factor transporter transmembrane protein EcfT [Actinomycetota bacterium]